MTKVSLAHTEQCFHTGNLRWITCMTHTQDSHWETLQRTNLPLTHKRNPSQSPSPSSNQNPSFIQTQALILTHFWQNTKREGEEKWRKKNLYVLISHAEKAVSHQRSFPWVIYTNKTEYKNKIEHVFAQQSPSQLSMKNNDLLDC